MASANDLAYQMYLVSQLAVTVGLLIHCMARQCRLQIIPF
jgi:hypothetical protein